MGASRLSLIVYANGPGYNPSQDAVREFESSIRAASQPRIIERSLVLGRLVGKAVTTLAVMAGGSQKTGPTSPAGPNCFSVLMGPDFAKCMPSFLRAARRSVYMFDAFPRYHTRILRFATALRVDDVFFSSSQVAAMMRAAGAPFSCHWVPEGIRPSQYRSVDYDLKDIDILNFGRRYREYHDRLASAPSMGRRRYLFERANGAVVFPDRESFIDGLARTKISICFPCNVTHPERAQGVSTMTVRYLQSMASKCLIVGQAPDEMRRLFSHDPVVPADLNDPAGQIEAILSDFGSYVPLIERNYTAITSEHSWAHRWEAIRTVLDGRSRTAYA